jgi:microcystin-dependent protein
VSNPYVGEIRLVGFNFAPENWLLCDGRLLSIAQNETLFSLIGTTYGGDGETNFALPDLRGRAPVHSGGSSSYVIGEIGGVENVTLTGSQLPAHTHPVSAQATNGNTSSPSGASFAGSSAGQYTASSTGLTAPILQTAGGSQPHDNLMPYVCANWIISLYGIYPSQN